MTESREQSGPRVPDEQEISVPWILGILLRGRRTIFAFVVIGAIVALVVALSRPILYTSEFSFIPQSGQDQTRSGLASLAGQFGIAVGVGGQVQPPQLYADLLQTREILSRIASDSVLIGERHHVSVAEFLDVEAADSAVSNENAIRALRQKVISASVAARTTGVVTVRVRTELPTVSLRIAQQLLDGLNRFNIATRRSQASEERQFTEGRLTAAKSALRAAEDALQAFLQANRQFENSPQLGFQRDRLQREVSLQQQVVSGLAQQYEDARIREVRDTPVITVIDRPMLPVIPDPRGRAMTLVLGVIGAIVVGIVSVLAREGWERQRRASPRDPSYGMLVDEWRTLHEKAGSTRQE